MGVCWGRQLPCKQAFSPALRYVNTQSSPGPFLTHVLPSHPLMQTLFHPQEKAQERCQLWTRGATLVSARGGDEGPPGCGFAVGETSHS